MSNGFPKPSTPGGARPAAGGPTAADLVASMQVFSALLNDATRTALQVITAPAGTHSVEVVESAKKVVDKSLQKLNILLDLIELHPRG